MKQLTRQEVEAVVERLADKTLSRGCLIREKTGFPHVILMKNSAGNYLCEVMNNVQHTIKKSQIKEVLGHPIYIGTVLEKMSENTPRSEEKNLLNLWAKCGFSKSLQEIIEESGWERVRVQSEIIHIQDGESWISAGITSEEVLTSPEANALFSFLQEIL